MIRILTRGESVEPMLESDEGQNGREQSAKLVIVALLKGATFTKTVRVRSVEFVKCCAKIANLIAVSLPWECAAA